MKNRKYSDWFGSGDTEEDVKKAIKKHGEPLSVYFENSGYMAALVYADKVVCVGYDGNEYQHNFVMDEASAQRTKLSGCEAVRLECRVRHSETKEK